MWIRGWAWRLWRLWPGRTTFGVPGPPGEPLPPDRPRRFTEQHARLLSQLQSEAVEASADWSRTALFACLEHLRTSSVTEAGQVAVRDAWADGPDAFCVVYQPPYQDGEVGIRRSAGDAETPTQKKGPGDLTDGYDMGRAELPDPVAFGWNVADFDIGEPLGALIDSLRRDSNGIGWWGSLDDVLPMRHTPP